MPRFITLYSGSSGNSCVIEQDGRYLMIDMGGSCKATVNALASVGLEPSRLEGILVTHEHSDHIKGLKVFLKKHNLPVFGSAATLDAISNMEAVPDYTELVAIDGRKEDIAGFKVLGFDTSHDSAGCNGFYVETPAGTSMALATDLGMMTAEVLQYLSKAQLVALEANYDRDMLYAGRYPYFLKKRIESPRGHLSNTDSAATVAALVAKGCRQLTMCHLSHENNHPVLVQQAIEMALQDAGMEMPQDCTVQIARRYEPGNWMEF